MHNNNLNSLSLSSVEDDSSLDLVQEKLSAQSGEEGGGGGGALTSYDLLACVTNQGIYTFHSQNPEKCVKFSFLPPDTT